MLDQGPPALDAGSGEEWWQFPIPENVPTASLVVANGLVYVSLSYEGELLAIVGMDEPTLDQTSDERGCGAFAR